MGTRIFITAAVLLAASVTAVSAADSRPDSPRKFSVSGRVSDAATGEAVPGAGLLLADTGVWTVSDDSGNFCFNSLASGTYEMEVSCLGYVTGKFVICAGHECPEVDIRLSASSLALDEVTVIAARGEDAMNSTLIFGREALDHLQISDVSDIAALLPGGKTSNPDLTAANPMSLRDGGSSAGNAAFGTAVEVDGVRIGTNASFGAMGGVDTRNIQVENIESVEVQTGVPSAEYGDLGSGLVRIHTKKGRTPR